MNSLGYCRMQIETDVFLPAPIAMNRILLQLLTYFLV